MPHPTGSSSIQTWRFVKIVSYFNKLRGARRCGAPKIGEHVDVGAGAKILGAVTIGPNAKIGANCVVLRDIPPGATAVGIKALNV